MYQWLDVLLSVCDTLCVRSQSLCQCTYKNQISKHFCFENTEEMSE